MSDLKNPKVIIAKGLLFVFLGCLAGMVLLLRAPGVVNTLLLCVTIWAFCRFYYFAFCVIQNYVDSDIGIILRCQLHEVFNPFVRQMNRRKREHVKTIEKALDRPACN